MKDSIALPGNSSADLAVELDSRYGLVVRKTCFGNSADRLMVQASKQEKFVSHSSIRTPKIYEKLQENNKSSILMEYVRGNDFVLFTNTASPEDFSQTVKVIVDLVKNQFFNSTEENFPKDVWQSKVSDTIESCKKRNLFLEDELKKIQLSLQSIPDQILLGECHGDLTFSNIIVERPGKICIFDFLNPPFETPYEDAAKFLQDAQFFWSIMKHKGNFDKTRVMIYWSYAESILRSELEKICDFNTLRKFQILGLLRIIPYTFDDKILQSLRKLVTNEVENDLSSPLRR